MKFNPPKNAPAQAFFTGGFMPKTKNSHTKISVKARKKNRKRRENS